MFRGALDDGQGGRRVSVSRTSGGGMGWLSPIRIVAGTVISSIRLWSPFLNPSSRAYATANFVHLTENITKSRSILAEVSMFQHPKLRLQPGDAP